MQVLWLKDRMAVTEFICWWFRVGVRLFVKGREEAVYVPRGRNKGRRRGRIYPISAWEEEKKVS